jgi:hypothetical protein
MTEDRMQFHLWNWSRWMHAGASSHLRYRHTASGGMGRSGSTDFADMVDSSDRHCAEATDGCIESLPPAAKAAVYASHLDGPWPTDIPLHIFYRCAVVDIGRRLDRLGIA